MTLATLEGRLRSGNANRSFELIQRFSLSSIASLRYNGSWRSTRLDLHLMQLDLGCDGMCNLNLSMFRAYDIRTASENLSDELAERLARAEAVYFRESLGAHSVLLAHDARRTGPHYFELAAHVYRNAGLDVVVVPGVCSSSLFYFAAMMNPQLAAIMVGASHNPAGDTGRKILGPGVRPIARQIGPDGGLDRIQQLYCNNVTPPSGSGRIMAYDPIDQYISYSMQLAGVKLNSLRNLRVFHDYLNGAASREMMLAFERAGADLTPAHFAPDGGFPLGDPNPVKQDVIREGLDALRSGDFLIGTFFDGDGDRIDFYRGDGSYLSSSFVYAGILPGRRNQLSAPDVSVFADLKANPAALVEIVGNGVAVDMIRNGHSQIKEALYADPSKFGAVEESAHFYEAFEINGQRYCTENTLYIALLVSRLWYENPKRFDTLLKIQDRTAREREWGHKFPTDEQRSKALEAVQTYFLEQGAQAESRTSQGLDLEATIIRRGLPFRIDIQTCLAFDWLQICQRISQSEDGLARWELVAADSQIAKEARRKIIEIVQSFGGGPESQG